MLAALLLALASSATACSSISFASHAIGGGGVRIRNCPVH